MTLGPCAKLESGPDFTFQMCPGDWSSGTMFYSGPISDFYSDIVGAEQNKPGLSKRGDLKAEM